MYDLGYPEGTLGPPHAGKISRCAEGVFHAHCFEDTNQVIFGFGFESGQEQICFLSRLPVQFCQPGVEICGSYLFFLTVYRLQSNSLYLIKINPIDSR